MNVNDAMSELELYSSVHLDMDCPPVGEWPTILDPGVRPLAEALRRYSQSEKYHGIES